MMPSTRPPELLRNRPRDPRELKGVISREEAMNTKPLILLMAAGAMALAAPLLVPSASAVDLDKEIPAAQSDPANPSQSEVAVLAGGCFWGQQGLFEHVKGVTKVVAGYSGGPKQKAHYDLVSDGDTGHAESVQITFDPH